MVSQKRDHSQTNTASYISSFLKEKSKVIVLSLGIGIAVLLLLALLVADRSAVAGIVSRFTFKTLGTVFLFCLANYLLRFAKWHYYLREMRLPVGILSSAAIFFSGLAMSPTPARSGELLKTYWLKNLHNADASQSASIVVSEWVTDSLGAVILAAAGAMVFECGRSILGIVAGMLIFFLVMLRVEKLAVFLLNRLKNTALARFSDRLRKAYLSARQLLDLKNLAAATLISLGSWSMEVCGLAYLLRGMQMPVGFLKAAFVFCFASILGTLTMFPAGVGVVESGMVGLLMLVDGPRNEAVVATAVIRAGTLWLGVIIGLFCWAYLFSRHFFDLPGEDNTTEITQQEQ